MLTACLLTGSRFQRVVQVICVQGCVQVTTHYCLSLCACMQGCAGNGPTIGLSVRGAIVRSWQIDCYWDFPPLGLLVAIIVLNSSGRQLSSWGLVTIEEFLVGPTAVATLHSCTPDAALLHSSCCSAALQSLHWTTSCVTLNDLRLLLFRVFQSNNFCHKVDITLRYY